MPDIPEFDSAIDVRPAQMPETPETGGIGAAIAGAANQIAQPLQEFQRKAAEAQRTTEAADLSAKYTPRLGDLALKSSLIPDQKKAIDAYTQGVAPMRAELDQMDLDPRVRAVVLRNFDDEAAAHQVSVSQQAFGRQANAAVALTMQHAETYAHQYALAGQQGNELLQKTYKDRYTNEVNALVHDGYLSPEEGVKMTKDWNSSAIMNDIMQQADTLRAAGNYKAIDNLADKVRDRANFPDLLENERNTADSRLQSLSWKVWSHDQERENKARAATATAYGNYLYDLTHDRDPSGPAPSAAALESVFPGQGKAMAENLHQIEAIRSAGQSIALTPLSQDFQNLANFTLDGKPKPGSDPKLFKLYDRYSKSAYDALKAQTDAKVKALTDDAAGYVIAKSPEVAAAYAAAQRDNRLWPQANALMNAALDRIGVPRQGRSLIPKGMAQNFVGQFTANPGNAVNTVRGLQSTFRGHFPAVMSDMIAQNLPEGFQLLPTLANANDQNNLARILAETQGGPGRKAKTPGDLIGDKNASTITHAFGVNNNVDFDRLRQSWIDQGMPGQQVAGLTKAVQDLAIANMYYGIDKTPEAAVAHAITSVGDKYAYSPLGSARTTKDKFDWVYGKAQDLITGLKSDQITIPKAYTTGKAGMPKPDEYPEYVRNNHSFVQSTNGGWWWVRDGQGRLVRDRQGRPIGVNAGLDDSLEGAQP